MISNFDNNDSFFIFNFLAKFIDCLIGSSFLEKKNIHVKPRIVIYNKCISFTSQAGCFNKAKKIHTHQLKRARSGDEILGNISIFNLLTICHASHKWLFQILAWCRLRTCSLYYNFLRRYMLAGPKRDAKHLTCFARSFKFKVYFFHLSDKQDFVVFNIINGTKIWFKTTL